MSNAAVINATSTSGQTAGTPISIETGGDVVLKAYGTGSGNWFVAMAFAPVVNGVTGAPVTLTIDYNQPGRQTSAVGASATEWVGWVLDQGGTWEASGIVEGYQPGEALSDDLGTFASFDALPQYGVKIGARASVNGVQYTYGAAGWVSSEYGPIYNGTTLPLPTSGECCRIRVANPAVPRGWSWLEWTGTIWAPPSGELIAAAASSTPGPLALVTPGVTTLTQIWASEVIPDYMIPELLEFEIDANLGVKNPSPVAGYVVGVGISGAIPTGASQYNYPASFFGTPGPTYFAGIGGAWTGKRAQAIRHFGAFKHPDPYTAGGGTSRDANTCGNFVSGSNRAYAMAKPSSVSDQVRLDCVQVYSKGNL